MRSLALLLPLVLGACSLGDCSFETSRSETVGALLSAHIPNVGDTLTVAFVVGTYPDVVLSVDAGVGEAPDLSPTAFALVLYDAVASGTNAAPPPLRSTARGDTAFVYLEGTLDPTLFLQACSPAEPAVDVRVRDLRIPQGVDAVRVVEVALADLPGQTGAAVRQRRAARHAARLITT